MEISTKETSILVQESKLRQKRRTYAGKMKSPFYDILVYKILKILCLTALSLIYVNA